MVYSQSGELPRHVYGWVDMGFVGGEGWEEVVWFGLSSVVGRMWGCTVMMGCGAVYRDLPLHALASCRDAVGWGPRQAQRWDCYSRDFTTLEWGYLKGVGLEARCGDQVEKGTYLFTASPIGDGFTSHPAQAKEFVFASLDNGRFTAQPTNRVLFHETSFCSPRWPVGLKRMEETFSCEDP
jgi:hypothetical protein